MGFERIPPDEEPPFDCPHCGGLIEEIGEEYTVGSFPHPNGKCYPHAKCPHCGKCMGCLYPRDPPEEKESPEIPPEPEIPLEDELLLENLIQKYKGSWDER